jgi:hypothetical protein
MIEVTRTMRNATGTPERPSTPTRRKRQQAKEIDGMKRAIYSVLAATALAWAGASLAQGASCADEIKKVDDALAKAAKADGPRTNDARKLRNDAEKQQADGKTAECLATIERAKAMLGVR